MDGQNQQTVEERLNYLEAEILEKAERKKNQVGTSPDFQENDIKKKLKEAAGEAIRRDKDDNFVNTNNDAFQWFVDKDLINTDEAKKLHKGYQDINDLDRSKSAASDTRSEIVKAAGGLVGVILAKMIVKDPTSPMAKEKAQSLSLSPTAGSSATPAAGGAGGGANGTGAGGATAASVAARGGLINKSVVHGAASVAATATATAELTK